MSNGEKLQKTMEEASKQYEKLPEWAKTESPKTSSASVERTVRPTSENAKKR